MTAPVRPGLSLARHFRRGPLTGYDAPPVGNAMKRRSRAGGEPIKGRRHKAAKPKHRIAPKAVRQMPFSPISPNKVDGNDVVQQSRQNQIRARAV